MSAVRRRTTALAGALVVTLAASGCGSDAPEDRYAADWDAICGDVQRITQQFRTDLVTAARATPDAGDAAARDPLAAVYAAAVLDRPARRLQRALRGPLRDARRLEAPDRWRTWNDDAVARFATQLEVATIGTQRLIVGDAEALPSVALGGFGPAAVSAPQELRDRTPVCVSLR